MQTRIYLVRHTETIGNIEKRLTGRQDYEITQNGLEMVKKLTNYLRNEPISAIYSSTSNRTFETIKEIAEIKKLEVQRKEELCEMYFGIYDGWKWEDLNKINLLIHEKHMKINEIMCIPEQETTIQVTERMYKEIKNIAKENLGKTILICSHGVAIEAFLRKITKEQFKYKKEEYSQHNCSVNIVEYDSKIEKFSVKLLNYIGY